MEQLTDARKVAGRRSSHGFGCAPIPEPLRAEFWLERLVEASCFDDLDRDYVLERYRHEIEGPLGDIENELDRCD